MQATIAGGILAEDEIRVDGHRKVSGREQYTADTQIPNCLWAAFTTSPHAFARIVRVDTRAAQAVPGVRAVLTAADIGPRRFGRQIFDWPVLAYDLVRYIGDRVAAVAAETREAAEEAARLVEVTYDELEPVLSPAAAIAPGAPVLHPDWHDYRFLSYLDREKPRYASPNIHGEVVIARGDADIEPIFAAAHRVFEHRFSTPRQHCGYIEPHATVVWIDDDGTVHVRTPNKSPFALRSQLAFVAEIPPEKIVIEPAAIGGDFGGKGLTIDDFPCYFLARVTRRPVRFAQSYSNELGANTVRHAADIVLRTAVDADGRFLAHTSNVLYAGGAYAAAKVIHTLLQGLGYAAIPYHVPHLRIEVHSVYTNTIPAAHVRAPGDVQTFWAWEQHVDAIAGGLGIDAIDLRLRNLIRDGGETLTGEPVAGAFAMGSGVLETLRREGRFAEPLPAGRGRGISLTCRDAGLGTTSLRLRLDADGRFLVSTGVPDQGGGQHTVLQRVVAATLDVAPARIAVRRGNTAEVERDAGTGASRVTHVAGGAAKDAAEKLRSLLEDRSGLRLAHDAFVDAAGNRHALEDVAADLCGAEPIEVVGTFDGVFNPHNFAFSAFAIEVAVDRDTGAFSVTDALFVTDVGAIINPVSFQGQIDGGFIYGLGQAALEEIPLDEGGKPITLNLGEYKLPTFMDIPPFRTVLVESPPGAGPFGAKLAGELTNPGVAPALFNAIAAATGVRIMQVPVTAERIFAALASH